MKTKFGAITQPHISKILLKINTWMLALIMSYETRADSPKQYFRVLVFVIYTMIKNYICSDYLACQSKKLGEMTVGSRGGSKYGDKCFDRILGIRIPYL